MTGLERCWLRSKSINASGTKKRLRVHGFEIGGRNEFERFENRQTRRLRRLERSSTEFSSRASPLPAYLVDQSNPTFLFWVDSGKRGLKFLCLSGWLRCEM